MFDNQFNPHFCLDDIKLQDLKEENYYDPYYFLRRPLEPERLNAIYQQAFIFDLLYRFAKEHLPTVQEIPRKEIDVTNEKTTDTTIDSIKDKVLDYLFRNQIEIKEEKESKNDLKEPENIWNTEEIGILRKNLVKIKEENFHLKSQLAVAIEHSKNLNEKLEKFKVETKHMPGEIKTLEQTNERLYIRVQDMESRYKIYVSEMEKLENLVKNLSQNEEDLKSKLNERNTEKLKLELENNQLNTKLNSYKNELKSYFIAKCEKYKLKYLKEINKLRDKLTAIQDLLKQEKVQHEKCKKGLDHLRNHFMYTFVPGDNFSKIDEKNISSL